MTSPLLIDFTCNKCGDRLITVHVDAGYQKDILKVGHTPGSIACSKLECTQAGARMRKGEYLNPPPVEWGDPTHEWYKPSQAEIQLAALGERDFLNTDGLKLRERTDAPMLYHPEDPDAE